MKKALFQDLVKTFIYNFTKGLYLEHFINVFDITLRTKIQFSYFD